MISCPPLLSPSLSPPPSSFPLRSCTHARARTHAQLIGEACGHCWRGPAGHRVGPSQAAAHPGPYRRRSRPRTRAGATNPARGLVRARDAPATDRRLSSLSPSLVPSFSPTPNRLGPPDSVLARVQHTQKHGCTRSRAHRQCASTWAAMRPSTRTCARASTRAREYEERTQACASVRERASARAPPRASPCLRGYSRARTRARKDARQLAFVARVRAHVVRVRTRT